jgi:hypothetical protein
MAHFDTLAGSVDTARLLHDLNDARSQLDDALSNVATHWTSDDAGCVTAEEAASSVSKCGTWEAYVSALRSHVFPDKEAHETEFIRGKAACPYASNKERATLCVLVAPRAMLFSIAAIVNGKSYSRNCKVYHKQDFRKPKYVE